jgi:LytS/YehU family sensor histidine kinase
MEDNEGLIFIIVVFIVVCIWLYSKLTTEKKQRDKLARKNAKLIADNALLEAEHLKFQLQPHTLRNMVATLHVASKNLYKGSEALAETLDYILYHGNKHLVSVADELTFLESYKSLQGNFVYQTNSIKIDKSAINTNSKYYSATCLPHLITAYFIENAFKHGDVNHPEFLTIRLKLSDKTFEMSVVNRINQKPNNHKGGLGLTNMRKRLDILLSGKYEIKNSCNEQEYHSTLTIHF